MRIFRRKKSFLPAASLQGFTDWHSHILPGVDDGVRTFEEAISILQRFEELGVKRIWLTPHIMEDYPNSTDFLKQRFSELCSRYEGGIELNLGSENMLDNIFGKRLDADDVLPLENKHLLVETSYFNPPLELDSMFNKIMETGYQPVLAHPERYIYMNRDVYKSLKNRGIKFQLNLTSLIGKYGKEAQKKSQWLMNNGYYDFSGTDIHSNRLFDYISD